MIATNLLLTIQLLGTEVTSNATYNFVGVTVSAMQTNRVYEMEIASSPAAGWTSLGSFSSTTTNVVTWYDFSSDPMRFYRVIDTGVNF